MRLSCVIILMLTFVNSLCSTHLYDRHVELFNYLFVENYTSAIRSKCEHEPLNVTIDVALREIVEVSEKSESVQLKIWVRLRWNDCKFIWNPMEFGNISTMVVPYDKIWVPDITLFESIDDIANMPDKKEYNAAVKYSGEVMYRFPTIIHSTCGMDVSRFPFDKQTCKLTFGSWIHTTDDIDVYQLTDHGDLSAFLDHQEWIVLSLSAERDTPISQGDSSFSKVVYRLTIKRRPIFYIVTVILPFFILTILSLAGFLLPSISGEKITFHMTILLSVTVFLLLIQEKLPASSDTFPIIGVYFAVTLIMTCLACVLSAIVLYFFYNDLSGKAMPHWIRVVFLEHLAKLIFVKNRRLIKEKLDQMGEEKKANRETNTFSSESAINQNETAFQGNENARNDYPPENENSNLRNKQEIVYEFGNTLKDSKSTGRLMNDWELLAFTLDRFFTLLYIALIVIKNIAILITMSLHDNIYMD